MPSEEQQYERRQETTIIQKLLPSVTSKNVETSRTKNPDSSLCLCVSNVQSAALKWSDLRYK